MLTRLWCTGAGPRISREEIEHSKTTNILLCYVRHSLFKRSLEIKIYCPIVIIKRILKYNVEIVKLSCIITGVSFDFLTSLGFKNIIHCSRERERAIQHRETADVDKQDCSNHTPHHITLQLHRHERLPSFIDKKESWMVIPTYGLTQAQASGVNIITQYIVWA